MAKSKAAEKLRKQEKKDAIKYLMAELEHVRKQRNELLQFDGPPDERQRLEDAFKRNDRRLSDITNKYLEQCKLVERLQKEIARLRLIVGG